MAADSTVSAVEAKDASKLNDSERKVERMHHDTMHKLP